MFGIAISSAIWTWPSISGQNSVSDLTLQNVEALSNGEITVVGCKPMHGATCYFSMAITNLWINKKINIQANH